MEGRIENFGVSDIRAALKPTKAIPIDARCMFSDLEAAQAAAATACAVGDSSSNYYIGMKLCVDDGKSVSWYTIGRDKKLHIDDVESSTYDRVDLRYVDEEGYHYRIVFKDENGNESYGDFTAPKGADGKDGSSLYTVDRISQGDSDLKGVWYSMVFSDGKSHQFKVFTPYIKDGNWWVGDRDLGTNAIGIRGDTPSIEDGYWWIGGNNTGVKAKGEDGKDGAQGLPGKDGKNGTMFGISGHYYLDVDDNNEIVVHYTDGEKIPDFYYDKDNGDLYIVIDEDENVRTLVGSVKGKDGATIQSIEYVESDDNGNYVYRMTFSDNSTADFTVPIADAVNKVDKLENKSTTEFVDKLFRDAVYAEGKNGSMLMYTSIYRNPDTVAVRAGNGCLSVNPPVSNYDAATKGYVDDIATNIAKSFAKSISFRVESDGTFYLITED